MVFTGNIQLLRCRREESGGWYSTKAEVFPGEYDGKRKKKKRERESRKCSKSYKYDNGASNLKVKRDVTIRDVKNCGKVMEAMARRSH